MTTNKLTAADITAARMHLLAGVINLGQGLAAAQGTPRAAGLARRLEAARAKLAKFNAKHAA